jgi:hypothetical protein
LRKQRVCEDGRELYVDVGVFIPGVPDEAALQFASGPDGSSLFVVVDSAPPRQVNFGIPFVFVLQHLRAVSSSSILTHLPLVRTCGAGAGRQQQRQ